MKIISSRSSKDKEKNLVKKTIRNRHDLSGVPQKHVQHTVPSEVPANPVQQPLNSSQPQSFSYPKTELTPSQQAALQNVLYKKEQVYENPGQKNSRDIHAYSDRKLNKRRSRGKSIVSTILVLMVLAAVLFAGWYYMTMVDRDPPTADPVDVTILIGESVKPEDFVENVEDESEIVSIEFVEKPNVLAHTNQAVQVKITDEHGNSAIFESTLIIRINTSPPVIEGIGTIVTRVGNPILYRQGITARDDLGRDLTQEININSSNVNHNAVGEYQVTYQVKDITGLETIITETVKVVNVDVDYVHEQIDGLLAEILTDDMTQLQKVRAIHYWVTNNIVYAQTIGGGETVYDDAYRALRDRGGNCFNYYAIGEVMLTRSGIENMPIERIAGTPTRHRWSLVNPDNLGWHHFDATRTRLQLGSATAFFTDSQAKEFTRRFVDFNGTQDYFTYDPWLYPDIVP